MRNISEPKSLMIQKSKSNLLNRDKIFLINS